MTSHESWPAALASVLGLKRPDPRPRRVGGGCINESFRYETATGPVFVKLAPRAQLPMFEAEAAGLRELGSADAIRVPAVLAVGEAAGQAFLALEWIEFRSAGRAAGRELGELLARQHRVTAARFGWERDNTIGSTPQPNGWCSDWVEFYRERRLAHQLALAQANGADAGLIDRSGRLLEVFDAFFTSYRPVPSLLHGDLWGGNWGVDESGHPVIFDPAVYYGDREADIAMTHLFGGFGPAFYAAYQASWPLDQAAGTRRALYNLYHVLNHYNLFGGGYLEQARSMVDSLLATLGC